MGKSRARMPAFYRQSIQNAVNLQINISKSKRRTMLNSEAIGQVVSYCTIAEAHDLWDWGEKESTILTLKMNNAASRYILDLDKYGTPEARKRLRERTAHLMPEDFCLPAGEKELYALTLTEALPPRQLVVVHNETMPISQASREFIELLENGSKTPEAPAPETKD